MARTTVSVDNYTYEGTDAHRTLLNLGELWAHHVHGRTPSVDTMLRSADALAKLFAPLANTDEPSSPPTERLTMLGSLRHQAFQSQGFDDEGCRNPQAFVAGSRR